MVAHYFMLTHYLIITPLTLENLIIPTLAFLPQGITLIEARLVSTPLGSEVRLLEPNLVLVTRLAFL